MSTVTNISQAVTPLDDQLKELVSRYTDFISDEKINAEIGGQMLNVGSKTALVQQLETFLVNPWKFAIAQKENADDNLFSMVDNFIRIFIAKSKEINLIKSAFIKINRSSNIFYGIVLNEDSFENRERVFHFLNFYTTLDLSEKVPVYFQIIPPHLENKFSGETFIA